MSVSSPIYGPAGSTPNISRPIALFLGVTYLGVGVVGFAATGFHGFVTPHAHGSSLFGFPLNVFHNIVHIGIGSLLIVASRLPDATMTQGILFGVAILYLAAVVLGFAGKLPIISDTTAGNPDNFLHFASMATAFLGGAAGAIQQRNYEATFGA